MKVISSSGDSAFDSKNHPDDNLNPNKYRVLREKRIKNFIIMKILYLDCNIEHGNKILVFKDCTLLDIVNQKEGIIPEFCDNQNIISPIAIFKPDDNGWNFAVSFAENFK